MRNPNAYMMACVKIATLSVVALTSVQAGIPISAGGLLGYMAIAVLEPGC